MLAPGVGQRIAILRDFLVRRSRGVQNVRSEKTSTMVDRGGGGGGEICVSSLMRLVLDTAA